MHFINRDNTYGFFRYNEQEVVFVYINNSNHTQTVPWTRYAEITEGLGEGRNVITGEKITMEHIKVEPMSSLVVEFVR